MVVTIQWYVESYSGGHLTVAKWTSYNGCGHPTVVTPTAVGSHSTVVDSLIFYSGYTTNGVDTTVVGVEHYSCKSVFYCLMLDSKAVRALQ